MRILFVSWRDLASPNAGGSEEVIDHLMRALQGRGHETALMCGGPTAVRPYPVTPLGGTYTQYLRAPIAARKFADWDLLVDVANGVPFFSPLWWSGPRLCLFHHVHGEQWSDYFPAPVAALGKLLEERAVPLVYRNTDFLAVSGSTARDLETTLGVDPRRVHRVSWGIDNLTRGDAVPERAEPTFVALGRLASNKAIDRLFDIWDEVRPATGGRLIVIGDGPERDRLEAIAPAGVTFTGRVSEEEKVALLSQAWLLVHAAPREGWGIVILEAAAQGTPTIAFDVAGVRDAVVDGETGVLVDGASAFAQEWIALAADAERRADLGRRARARAQTFTWDAAVDQFLEVATATITRRGRTPGAEKKQHPKGLRRSANLFRLYRREPLEPARFYEFLANDTMAQLERYDAHISGNVVDVGGGPGYIAEAVRRRGGRPIVVEYNEDELRLHGRVPRDAVVGDGQALPLRTGLADVVHSSNVLEHVPRPFDLLEEMVRVLKPGGVGYLSYTPWLSPWGGHETSPWHFLGGEHAASRYEGIHGVRPKNDYGTSLFTLRMKPVLRWFTGAAGVEVLWDGPRYWPPSWRPLARVPVAGEVVTWNHMVVFRRTG